MHLNVQQRVGQGVGTSGQSGDCRCQGGCQGRRIGQLLTILNEELYWLAFCFGEFELRVLSLETYLKEADEVNFYLSEHVCFCKSHVSK
jgi:hypothetical protein